MNTYYKIAILYVCIAAFFSIVGFYVTHGDRDLVAFYGKPYLVDKEQEPNAVEDGEIA